MNLDPSQYPALKTELQAARYSGMTDAQATAELNRVSESDTLALEKAVPAYRVVACVSRTDFGALSAQDRAYFQAVVSAGLVDVAAGSEARVAFLAWFPAGSATRDKLIALVNRPVPRAWVLFGQGVAVNEADVIRAKALP